MTVNCAGRIDIERVWLSAAQTRRHSNTAIWHKCFVRALFLLSQLSLIFSVERVLSFYYSFFCARDTNQINNVRESKKKCLILNIHIYIFVIFKSNLKETILMKQTNYISNIL